MQITLTERELKLVRLAVLRYAGQSGADPDLATELQRLFANISVRGLREQAALSVSSENLTPKDKG